jgi:two-component system, chemotaxis family, chemotaxis protein CheY
MVVTSGVMPSAPTSTLPPSILVIDDDDDLRGVVADSLEEAGYRVQTAVHGRDALTQMLDGLFPDLILLDLLMPEMNGWALMAELKARPALAAIPVVVVSAGGDKALNSAPVNAGCLAKPFALSRLLDTVERCLALKGAPDTP